MAGFRIERVAPCSPDAAWQRLVCWEAHSARVPLTAITVTTPPPTHEGTTFVARTGLGPLAFDDEMRVVRWEPPGASGDGTAVGRCRIEKRGRVVGGWSEIEVAPRAGGCRVVWSGEVRPRGVPGTLRPVVAWSARWLYGRIVDGLLGR
ncbi:SRPBCC family protein [Streptomyces sp. BHT-5-2]|uniref:SRPBCC family protein n=1 Tax=unclassified Streptomyces TaxID=2593676 RepID=UPI001C8D35C5|nr:SRPBCC family protein [Streptomyces sp. BHT-5-2]QZL04978.1 SRPBCC family protein [Streptomyces sp. BHT-5-2]